MLVNMAILMHWKEKKIVQIRPQVGFGILPLYDQPCKYNEFLFLFFP